VLSDKPKNVSKCPLPQRPSGRAELTPLSESGGASILVTLSADEGAFLVEVIVDRAVNCGELLQTSHPPAWFRVAAACRMTELFCDLQIATRTTVNTGTQRSETVKSSNFVLEAYGATMLS
jgi:hypothetical protein